MAIISMDQTDSSPSLSPSTPHPGVTDVPHSYTVRIIQKKLPNTAKMVDDALIELHSTKGITMKQLSAYIAGKYVIVLTVQRKNLIKKRLLELRESENLKNRTGVGLNGHFKLADKKKFESTGYKQSKSVKPKKRISSRQKVRTKETEELARRLSEPVFPLPGNKRSMFDIDTPTGSPATTIPMNDDYEVSYYTPVSSLPAKKRYLGRRLEV